MLAIEINDSRLQLATHSIPEVKDKDVLIKVYAAGLNCPDIMQRKGLYPPPLGVSNIPGHELSGVVVKIGSHVTQITEGDKVCALVTGGGYAEYCLVTEELCLPIPKDFGFIQATALPETFFTVWNTLFSRTKLKKDETILIYGDNSGIGTTAIQLAKSFGATVFIPAGSTEKCNFLLTLGTDAAINYKDKDFVSEIHKLTENQGVNVIFDMIGTDYLSRNLSSMSFDARLMLITLQNGSKTETNLLPILLKRLTISGSTLRVIIGLPPPIMKE